MNIPGAGQRWRVLTNSKTEKSLQSSRSTSKNKKYTPTRSGNISQLQQKIKISNQSKLNSSDAGSNHRIHFGIQKSSSNRNLDLGLSAKQQSSPLKSERESFHNENPNKNSINLNQELASPLIVMKQLNKIRKIETDRDPPTKALFSLDEQHKFIHNQLHKIKIEFSKFKQLIEQQIIKQQQFIKVIVAKIYQQFDNMRQICNKCSQKFNNEGEEIHKDAITKNIQPFQLSLSQIKKLQSTQSKIALQKVFQSESEHLQKLLNEKPTQVIINGNNFHNEQKNTIQPSLSSEKFLRAKTERSQCNSLNSDKVKSKKEFEKLFEAVNCLKRDIKDLKGLSYQITKQESHSRKKIDLKQIQNGQKNLVESSPASRTKARLNIQKLNFLKN